jgi:hypothetical protein
MLGFESNKLESVRFTPGMSFGSGLVNTSTPDDFIRVLGGPSSQRVEPFVCNLIYTSAKANVRLVFFDDKLGTVWLERFAKRAKPWK